MIGKIEVCPYLKSDKGGTMMCSKEELLRQLIAEASVLTDEEVEEVLEYARREFEEAVEEGEREKKGSPAE